MGGVKEWQKVKEYYAEKNEQIHVGDIFPIATEKYSELEEKHREMKGRVVFRGSDVKDADGNVILFDQLRNAPASMEAGRSCIIYGSAEGHDNSCADAEQAYVQCVLVGTKTFCRFPKIFWPQSWHDQGFEDPVVELLMSLYGHPRAGDNWHDENERRLISKGWDPIFNWPGCFFHPMYKLFLVVYVDDYMMGGPK